LSWGNKDQYDINGPKAANNTGNLILKTAFDLHNMMRPSIMTNRYRIGCYRKPQEAQMTSTVVEYLQGIQMAKEAAAPEKNGSGNPKIRHEHFTRADDVNMRYTICSKYPMEAVLLAMT
jgi:hypothetical protein